MLDLPPPPAESQFTVPESCVFKDCSNAYLFIEKVFVFQSKPVCYSVTKCSCFSLSQCVIQ